MQQYYLNIKSDEETAEDQDVNQATAKSKLHVYKLKFEAVEKLLGKIPFYQCMIFVNSLPRSIELSSWLNDMGWKSGHINSNLSQDKRLSVMEKMRDFKIRVLVCSDLVRRCTYIYIYG